MIDVVINRHLRGGFGNNACEIITRKSQFSWYDNHPLKSIEPEEWFSWIYSNSTFHDRLSLIETNTVIWTMLHSKWIDSSNGSDHYVTLDLYNKSFSDPKCPSSRECWYRRFKISMIHGDHIFFNSKEEYPDNKVQFLNIINNQ